MVGGGGEERAHCTTNKFIIQVDKAQTVILYENKIHHRRTVVNHESLYFFVVHVVFGRFFEELRVGGGGGGGEGGEEERVRNAVFCLDGSLFEQGQTAVMRSRRAQQKISAQLAGRDGE